MIHRLALVLSLSAAPLLSRAAAPEQRPAVPPSAREAAKTPTSSDKPSGPAAPVAPAAKPAAATTTPEAAPPKGPGEMRAVLEAPLFSEAFRSVPIASIDGEPIALVQLTDALALSHTGRQEVQTREHDFHPVLDRLLNLKLCAIEARDMGLDKLPEVADQIRVFHEQMLQDFLRGESTKDVKSDPAEVERLFKDAVREWKVRSLLFEKEEDAKAFAAAAEGGKKFDAIAKPLLDAKKATGTLEAEFTPTAQLQPRVTQALAATEKGAITAPLRVQQGWTVLQVVDVRYPDDPAARAQAEAGSLRIQRAKALDRLDKDLRKKYATIDKKLLDRLDFEAKRPGFEALRKDKRAVVRIAGEKPLTVADLTAAVGGKFFHGIEGPIKENKVNLEKIPAFEDLLRKRLFRKEALLINVEALPDFQRAIAEYRDATLFTSLIDKAILQDVKVTEEEGQAYFEKHKAEFTFPGMYKLESLAFAKASDAQAVLQKLRAGTDFKWLRQNADGQIPPDKRSAAIDDVILSTSALTPGMAEVLSNAKVGDYRLFDDRDQHYVVRVVQFTPGREQSYQEARGVIGKKLVVVNLTKAIEAYAAKVRQAHDVKVYLTRIAY